MIFLTQQPVKVGLCLCTALILSSCGWLNQWPPGDKKSSVDAPYPEQIKVSQISEEEMLAMPPGMNTLPQPQSKTAVEEGPVVAAAPPVKTIEGQVLNPASVAQYKAAENESLKQRIAKLENDMAAIRNDMQTMMPALTKLVAVQQDLEALVAEIKPTQTTTMASPQPAPVVAAPVPMEQGSADPDPAIYGSYNNTAATNGFDIQDVRVGTHPDKTRIVLDVTEEAPVSYHIDQARNILTVDLPPGSGVSDIQKHFAHSELVKSVKTRRNGSAVFLDVQLKQAAKIIWSDTIKGNQTNPTRIVLDVAPV